MLIRLSIIATLRMWIQYSVDDIDKNCLVNLYLRRGRMICTLRRFKIGMHGAFTPSPFPSVLKKEHMFHYFIRLRLKFAVFAWYVQVLKRSNQLHYKTVLSTKYHVHVVNRAALDKHLLKQFRELCQPSKPLGKHIRICGVSPAFNN